MVGGLSPWHLIVVLLVLVALVGVPVLVITLIVKSSQARRVPRQPSTPPGWYPDPASPGFLRWFDGSVWTDNRVPGPPIRNP
ncbi:DUF2510 domain-containing protein [Nocardiaceae bacterium NPDC056970]